MATSNPGESRRAGLDEQTKELAVLLSEFVSLVKRLGPPRVGILGELERVRELGPRHGGVIVRLVLGGEMSVSELAARLGVTLTTASLLVGELARVGLVERREDETDRRRTLVRIPDAHRDEIEAWFESRISPVRRALGALPPERRKGLLDGMRLLVDELRSSTEGDPAAR